MLSLATDQPHDTGDETARLPVLPSSYLPESLDREASAAPETPTRPAVKIAVLGPTLRFKGDLAAQEDLILQGRIEGSVHQAQRIFIATGGVVVGSIHARSVVVDGLVEGDLHGVESVTVHKTGRVAGNIFAPRVVLVEGAVFNGRIDMSVAAVAERDGAGKIASEIRVENPVPGPALKLAVDQTDKAPAQKVTLVLPPPPVRQRVVRESMA
jgi:cytoskeletal protein CcmA (bactofilin family)